MNNQQVSEFIAYMVRAADDQDDAGRTNTATDYRTAVNVIVDHLVELNWAVKLLKSAHETKLLDSQPLLAAEVQRFLNVVAPPQ